MPVEKIEIQWLKTAHSSAAQVYTTGLEYCLVSGDLRQCHALVYCKDFLQDATWGSLNEKVAKIYGFQYDPSSRPPVCMQICRIALANQSDPKFREKIPNTIDFINQVAAELHLKSTKAYEIINAPKKYSQSGVFLFDGSQVWMNAPPLLSMYTLLLRVGFAHEIGKKYNKTIDGIINRKISQYQDEDSYQLKGAIAGIKKIMKIGYRKFFYIDSSKNYPSNVKVETMHENSGIMEFTKGHNLPVSYWNRKSLQTLSA